MTPLYPWAAGAWQQLLARRENLPQAMLMHGPRGIGKLDLARRFARLILCETPGVDQPCGRCDACRWFEAGQHPDFRQIVPEAMAPRAEASDEDTGGDGSSLARSPARKGKPSHEIKVDQIRQLADFLNIGSHRGKRRLALFNPAEDMNENAANSLLKSLEEPSSSVSLILVSSHPMRLLPTVRSRCVGLPLGIPPRAQSLAWLEGEGVADAADWLAFAGGAPLLARDYAQSERGERIAQLIGLLRRGGREALRAWPATEREHIEILAEVLQKWAYDQAFGGFGASGQYFRPGAPALGSASHQAWLRFAQEMGRLRLDARHPLNPRLFAADLISLMPR